MNPSSQRGSVSLVLVAVMGVVIILALLCTDLSRVLVARARAETAADASALAAAGAAALPGDVTPTEAASAFAAANGATLASCDCPPGALVVEVGVAVDVGDLLLLGSVGQVSARSRAETSEEGQPAYTPSP